MRLTRNKTPKVKCGWSHDNRRGCLGLEEGMEEDRSDDAKNEEEEGEKEKKKGETLVEGKRTLFAHFRKILNNKNYLGVGWLNKLLDFRKGSKD